MNKSVILMILPCVIAVAIVVVEGNFMTSGVQYSGLGGYGSYGSYGTGTSRQQYQQRYLQEFLKARQQRNQLNALAKQSTFANFVNYSKSNWTHLKKTIFLIRKFILTLLSITDEISNCLLFYYPLIMDSLFQFPWFFFWPPSPTTPLSLLLVRRRFW